MSASCAGSEVGFQLRPGPELSVGCCEMVRSRQGAPPVWSVWGHHIIARTVNQRNTNNPCLDVQLIKSCTDHANS